MLVNIGNIQGLLMKFELELELGLGQKGTLLDVPAAGSLKTSLTDIGCQPHTPRFNVHRLMVYLGIGTTASQYGC